MSTIICNATTLKRGTATVRTFLFAVLTNAIVAASGSNAFGVLLTDFQTSAAGQTVFPVSASDQINTGSPVLLGISSNGYTPQVLDNYGPVSALIDGDSGGDTGFFPSNLGGVMDLDGTWSFIVELDLTSAPQGYDITEIQTFTGHTDNRKSQKYAVAFSLVGDADFSSIGLFEFNYGTPNPGSTRLSITDSSGVIQSGVDAIRWDVQLPSAGAGAASVYREFDVYATETVPEPSTLTLIVLGLLSLGMTRRKRRR